jgi:predicted anti-sigma-YlaC factor YlaD
VRRFRKCSPLPHCEVVRQAISARLDGETIGLSNELLETHLQACDRCSAFDEDVVHLRRTTLMRATRTPPAGFVDLVNTIGTGRVANVPLNAAARHPRKTSVVYRTWTRRTVVGLTSVIACIAIPLGTAVHTRVVPSRDRTPCTAHLHQGYLNHAYPRSELETGHSGNRTDL